jgi:hypothetical protein
VLKLFGIGVRLLPQDVQMFPMDIPAALAILQDERAVAPLIHYMGLEDEDKPNEANEDEDSEDEIFFSIGQSSLR